MDPAEIGSLFGPATTDLALLETRLEESFAEDGLASGPMAELVGAGGKRLRPALVFLCARLGSPDPAAAMHAAMAVELVHSATLVHDDVIDDSSLRRGRPTVVAERGLAVAIVVADFYFARSYMEASRTGSAEAVALLAQAIMDVCDGELLQQALQRRYRVAFDDYERMISLKTAALMAASCGLGGLVGGLPPEQRGHLARFGRDLGVAFQIIDDVLDYSSEPDQLGKPAGHDLIEGNATLPLLLALEEMGDDSELSRILVEGDALNPAEVSRVVTVVRESSALDRARDQARELATRAALTMRGLPSSPARETLLGLVDYVVERAT